MPALVKERNLATFVEYCASCASHVNITSDMRMQLGPHKFGCENNAVSSHGSGWNNNAISSHGSGLKGDVLFLVLGHRFKTGSTLQEPCFSE